jgi:hypothetical protein
LLPMAVLLPIGVYRLVTARRSPFNWILLGGLATAPLPSVLVAEGAINRGLVLLPFAALVATFGVDYLVSANRLWLRLAGMCLILAVPMQFAFFYRDYLGDYRYRSGYWFENNIRGGIEEILDRTTKRDVPAIYLSKEIGWVDWYWRFYLNKYGRQALTTPTVYFDPKTLDVATVPRGSVVFAKLNATTDSLFGTAPQRKHATIIAELYGGEPSMTVFDW